MGFRAIGFRAKGLTILVEGELSERSGMADPYIDPAFVPIESARAARVPVQTPPTPS